MSVWTRVACGQGNLPLTSSAASAVGTGHLIVSMGQGTLDEVRRLGGPHMRAHPEVFHDP